MAEFEAATDVAGCAEEVRHHRFFGPFLLITYLRLANVCKIDSIC